MGAVERATGLAKPDRFTRALGQFCEIWRTKYGVWYEPTAADRNQLGRLLSKLSPGGLEELPKAFNGYLGDRSPFLTERVRHGLAHFCTSGGFNKYRTPAVVVTSQREVDNARAAEQWSAMRNGHMRNGHGGR